MNKLENKEIKKGDDTEGNMRHGGNEIKIERI